MSCDNRKIRALPERAIWITKTCPECGKQFTYNKQIARNKKFCSHKCTVKYNYRMFYRHHIRKEHYKSVKKHICPRCGNEFYAHPNAKYCPKCLEWLAYNSKEHCIYKNQYNSRKDCEGYIE